MIRSGKISERKRGVNILGFLKPIIILNSIIPWLLWKYIDNKNDEIEFADTFRYGISTLTFSLFYILQTFLIAYFFDWNIGVIYFGASLISVLLYSKSHPTQAELPLE